MRCYRPHMFLERDIRPGKTAAGMMLLTALSSVAYLPFVTGGLLTDDFAHLARQLTHPSLATLLVTPDTFHFYRPIPQASLWLDSKVFGMNPTAFRLTNFVLHVGVVLCTFVLGLRILGRIRAAFLASLAFALTPKAHPIAVLWISARPELLMSLFSLLAIISWHEWQLANRARWFVAAWMFYAMALLSKETAVLLPVLFLFTPSGSRFTARQWKGFFLMAATAAAIFAVRGYVGAVMPTTLDPHYGLMRPAARWVRNLENYLPRSVPSPLGMLVLVALPVTLVGRRDWRLIQWQERQLSGQLVYAIVWFMVFMLPVLPIVARSELYLYLPGFGLCLLAGSIVDAILTVTRARTGVAAIVLFSVVFGAYQISRTRGMHDDLIFSGNLLSGLRQSLEDYNGAVVVVPDDPATSEFLSATAGGYADLVLKMATGRYEVNGTIDYNHDTKPSEALRLHGTYRNGRLFLTRSSPGK
jgi:hypothetical protein